MTERGRGNLHKRSQLTHVRPMTSAHAKGRLVSPCLFGRHQLAPYWVMRPAQVGAGVVIPKVHFDRSCLRCHETPERVWSDIVGETGPLAEPMTLSAWLRHHGATVAGPGGEVRLPEDMPPVP